MKSAMKFAPLSTPLNEALVGSSRSPSMIALSTRSRSFPKEKTERKVDASPPSTLRVANP